MNDTQDRKFHHKRALAALAVSAITLFALPAHHATAAKSTILHEEVIVKKDPTVEVALGKGASELEFRGFPNHYARDLGNQIDLGVGADRALPLDYDLDFLRWSGDGLDQRTEITALSLLRRLALGGQQLVSAEA